jgi:hypothetical protein
MYRTLSQLQSSIQELIDQQGENAPVAAFIFTKNDVMYYEEDEDGFPNFDEEKFLNNNDTDHVLMNVGDCDYIYEQVNEMIADAIQDIQRKVK